MFSIDAANGSRTAAEGCGTALCWVLDSEVKQCQLELKHALWVPNYTRNLISVKKLAQQGGEVTFGKDAHIKTFDGTLLPLMLSSDDLYTLSVSFPLCVTLDQERPQWTVSQVLPEVASDTRVDQRGRVPKPSQVGRWSSGTRRYCTKTTMMWRAYQSW